MCQLSFIHRRCPSASGACCTWWTCRWPPLPCTPLRRNPGTAPQRSAHLLTATVRKWWRVRETPKSSNPRNTFTRQKTIPLHPPAVRQPDRHWYTDRCEPSEALSAPEAWCCTWWTAAVTVKVLFTWWLTGLKIAFFFFYYLPLGLLIHRSILGPGVCLRFVFYICAYISNSDGGVVWILTLRRSYLIFPFLHFHHTPQSLLVCL